MVNEATKLLFEEIKQLCITNGKAIDKIAKDTDTPQDLVAKMFIETMQAILGNMA